MLGSIKTLWSGLLNVVKYAIIGGVSAVVLIPVGINLFTDEVDKISKKSMKDWGVDIPCGVAQGFEPKRDFQRKMDISSSQRNFNYVDVGFVETDPRDLLIDVDNFKRKFASYSPKKRDAIEELCKKKEMEKIAKSSMAFFDKEEGKQKLFFCAVGDTDRFIQEVKNKGGWSREALEAVIAKKLPFEYLVSFTKNSCEVNIFGSYSNEKTYRYKDSKKIKMGKLNVYKFGYQHFNYNEKKNLKTNCSDLPYYEKVYFEDGSSFEFTTKSNVITSKLATAHKRNSNNLYIVNDYAPKGLHYDCVLLTPKERDVWKTVISSEGQ